MSSLFTVNARPEPARCTTNDPVVSEPNDPLKQKTSSSLSELPDALKLHLVLISRSPESSRLSPSMSSPLRVNATSEPSTVPMPGTEPDVVNEIKT